MTTTTKTLYLNPLAWRHFLATGMVDLPVTWPWQSMGQCPSDALVVDRGEGRGADVLNAQGQHLFELTPPVALGLVAVGRQVMHSPRCKSGSIEGVAVAHRVTIRCVEPQKGQGPLIVAPATYAWQIELRGYKRM